MLTTYQKNVLREEIKDNFRDVAWRSIYGLKLLMRYLKKSIARNPNAVMEEYDAGWDAFWQNKDYFATDKYPFVKNKIPLEPMISPFDYQLMVTDKYLGEKLEETQAKTVLEVGSGTGLHLLELAARYPHIHFYGLELTKSGVEKTRELLQNPPKEFEKACQLGKLENVTIIHGNILEDKTIEHLKTLNIDFVFTTTVLEQLHNYLDVVFGNIFSLGVKHFVFHEQWLDLNKDINKYRLLVNYDYFRAPLSILNQHPTEIIETVLPPVQPIGMNLSFVYGKVS